MHYTQSTEAFHAVKTGNIKKLVKLISDKKFSFVFLIMKNSKKNQNVIDILDFSQPSDLSVCFTVSVKNA